MTLPSALINDGQYRQLRSALIQMFVHNGCHTATEAADETVFRVLQKIESGVDVRDVYAYAHGVARNVLQEYWREQATVADQPVPDRSSPSIPDEDDPVLERCLERCKRRLSHKNRVLIEAYYQGEKAEKKENRRKLAVKLGISMDALRLRVHRIKRELSDCCEACRKEESAR